MRNKIRVFVLGLALCIVALTSVQSNAQSQTPIGHVVITGTATLSVSVGSLDTAFAQDCNYDSASDFHGATFTDVTLDEDSGVWYVEAFGVASSIPITRGIRLREKLNGDLVVYTADADGGGGTCESNGCNSGCEMVGESCSCGIAEGGGGGACTYKSGGSGGGSEDDYAYIIPWGGARASIGAGYIGNFY